MIRAEAVNGSSAVHNRLRHDLRHPRRQASGEGAFRSTVPRSLVCGVGFFVTKDATFVPVSLRNSDRQDAAIKRVNALRVHGVSF